MYHHAKVALLWCSLRTRSSLLEFAQRGAYCTCSLRFMLWVCLMVNPHHSGRWLQFACSLPTRSCFWICAKRCFYFACSFRFLLWKCSIANPHHSGRWLHWSVSIGALYFVNWQVCRFCSVLNQLYITLGRWLHFAFLRHVSCFSNSICEEVQLFHLQLHSQQHIPADIWLFSCMYFALVSSTSGQAESIYMTMMWSWRLTAIMF